MTVTWGRALAYDVVLVLVFLLLGSRTHDSTGSGHLAALAASFLVALAVGWGAGRAWRTPARPWPTGVIVWLLTVVVGVTLRGLLVPGAGFAPAFLAVATGFLGVTLLGWRGVAALASVRRRAR